MEDWIHAHKFTLNGTSYIWNWFVRILAWITCKLGWKVGDGLKIRLGVDPIAGLETSYILLVDLREYLADYGISWLAQAHKLDGLAIGYNGCLSAHDLDLGGEWDE